ncbi:uncharacterized protein A4U43_C04F16070 [Asparagus officinalis]|uniref:Uncharacterized protein n=1 Tax=Asparagus officinalis TaxID=4686 RepID=A0A5P1F6L3_ASPOF|nr:uncharacterized protein A4U43_C04F16070 [Asparagus officinalis]
MTSSNGVCFPFLTMEMVQTGGHGTVGAGSSHSVYTCRDAIRRFTDNHTGSRNGMESVSWRPRTKNTVMGNDCRTRVLQIKAELARARSI